MSNNSTRIYILDYMKSICIFMVIIMHTRIYNEIGNKALMPFYINMAVPCFMLISGFTLSIRLEKRRDNSLKYLKSDISHVLMPYIVSFFIVILMKILFVHQTYSLVELIKLFLSGEFGTGGYFVVVYIQIILLFPLMQKLIKNYNILGLIAIIGANILYEAVVWGLVRYGYDLSFFYKICSVRYFTYVSAGIFLYYYRKRIPKVILTISFILGVIYIISYAYLGWKPLFNAYWHHSSFYGVLFVMPVINFFIGKSGYFKGTTAIGKALMVVGKNTFYIFCVQMAFFTNRYSVSIGNLSSLVMCILALVICTAIGLIFGKIMTSVESLIKSKCFISKA